MTTLYRAATDLTARKGAHFAECIDDAIAYTGNPGFGGPTVAAYEVDGSVVELDMDDALEMYRSLVLCADARDAVADADDDDERIEAEAELAELEATSIYDIRQDLGDRGLVCASVHSVLESFPEVEEALAGEYDWVVFEDSYPAGCTTWRRLTDMSIEPIEVVS